jgi:hypothetical protein
MKSPSNSMTYPTYMQLVRSVLNAAKLMALEWNGALAITSTLVVVGGIKIVPERWTIGGDGIVSEKMQK